MKKKLKNAEMAAMLNQLRPVLVHRDKIGYFAVLSAEAIDSVGVLGDHQLDLMLYLWPLWRQSLSYVQYQLL